MCHVAGFVVGGVEVVYAALQAGFHYCEVLVGQCEVDNQVGVVAAQQGYHLVEVVGVDAVGAHIFLAYFFCQFLAFGECAGGYDYGGEHFGVLGAFVGSYSAHAAASYDNYFCHFRNLECMLCYVIDSLEYASAVQPLLQGVCGPWL